MNQEPRRPSHLLDTPLRRREALTRLGAGALWSLGLWPGWAQVREEQAPADSFQFIAVNDTHYMTPECGPWLEAAVERMKAHGAVELCLHSGDLTEHGQPDHLGAVREIFDGLGRPAYGVIGNHDYDGPDSRRAYDRVFPDRLNYVVHHREWQFIGLDTSEGQKYVDTRIQPATLGWLDDQLPRLNPAQPTVIFTHFPLGEGVTYRPANADEVLERFRPFNLRAIFSGHFHGYTERAIGEALATTNKCCALKRTNHDKTTEKGFFLCTARGFQIERQFIQC